jgi:predicted ATPase
MAKTTPRDARGASSSQFIQGLMVEGFKSIDSERSIEVRPLTILAGANSSGKSSAIQPLLLLKQTLEAAYDPGPLLLNGPNVNFTAVSQFLSKSRKGMTEGTWTFGVTIAPQLQCSIHFRKGTVAPIELDRVVTEERGVPGRRMDYRPGEMKFSESPLPNSFPPEVVLPRRTLNRTVRLVRNRCFLDLYVDIAAREGDKENLTLVPTSSLPRAAFESVITGAIHVAGLRGNPRRNYPLTAVGERFPGTFESYVASVIAAAQQAGKEVFISQLGTDLCELGLTWKVQAHAVDDTQVELKVGRLPRPTRDGGNDLVSIADVGFGVSQTLPVVVALLTAAPGQLVYIEQPEIHLHPRAQVAMAALLVRAANRGVRVVIETHSSLLLLGVQRLVAEEQIDPKKVMLHWFKRDETTGITDITSAELDAAGTFGEWPADFDDVSLAAQQQFLDAAEKKLAHEP